MSPLWPYRVNTLITLDALPPVLVSLRDRSQPVVENSPETAESQVVWSSVGLDNVEHTLTVSVGVGENLAIVDGLLYVIQYFLPLFPFHYQRARDTFRIRVF
jgi:hypothetical protein